MKHTRVVDANIIVRFFLNDHSTLSPKAQSIIQQAEKGNYALFIDEVVVAEIVWVLSSFYNITREAIGKRLLSLVAQPWVINRRKKLILQALEIYRITNLDYIDAWLLAVSEHDGLQVETFDVELGKMLRTRAKRNEIKN